ncbi:ADP-ribosyl-(dinitrogen reductase) hydrolase [Shewanella sp. SR44-4]|uniref:ADP-ribosyl-(dinitrogen reductase) hydrolase n=1 Tax=Shewanella TaxID=22 RepID=UPI001C7243F1|nr:ADP-ribosyl-(dinitrogen reductase) hydrolase [Shewanella sp. SR44-4]
MAIKMSKPVRDKLLQKHGVNVSEVYECFLNRTHTDLVDNREDHRTNPPTKWFISETDKGIKLKVCYIQDAGDLFIKSVFPPNDVESDIYNRFAKEM